jgi:lactoylglutathione lyase
MDVSHTALWIADLEAIRAFYVDGIGLTASREMVDDEGVTNLYVRGETDTELQFKHDPDGTPPGSTNAVDHIAISTDDIEGRLARLQERTDARVVRPVTEKNARRGNVAKVALIEDPSGYVVEFVEKR